MTLYRWIWVAAVAVLLYFHLLAGTLVAISTAFYWLLEKQHRESLEYHRPSSATLHASESQTPERLWCVRGKHYIGNEPYTFITEGAANEHEPVCLRCVQRIKKETDQTIKEWEEQKSKEAEWNALPETEREIRRERAKAKGFCPMCDKLLSLEGTCPMCCQIPDNPNAPMHKVKRILEWASLSELEKQKREAEFLAMRAHNLAKWCTQGGDGVWRRNDDGTEAKFD